MIWVDADACPRAAKEMVFRQAEQFGEDTRLVANSQMWTPDSDLIQLVLVDDGLNVADDYIVEHCGPGDIVITADIPLAAQIVDKGAVGLDPRGKEFNEDNVKGILATRNLMAELREAGMQGGGPPPYKPKDKDRFAQALNKMLHKRWRERNEGR